MRKLIVSEFITLDGVVQAPGGADEDRDGGFTHGGWTMPYWHDDIGQSFGALMQNTDAFLLGRRTYVTHANAFEPMPVGDPFGDMMNAPAKYVVSKTLEKPIWRNTTVIRENVVEAVKKLKSQPGKNILVDGSTHPNDSSELAFFIAGRKAFALAAEDAGPVALEPIMQLEVTCSDDDVGAVVGDLARRRCLVAQVQKHYTR